MCFPFLCDVSVTVFCLSYILCCFHSDTFQWIGTWVLISCYSWAFITQITKRLVNCFRCLSTVICTLSLPLSVLKQLDSNVIKEYLQILLDMMHLKARLMTLFELQWTSLICFSRCVQRLKLFANMNWAGFVNKCSQGYNISSMQKKKKVEIKFGQLKVVTWPGGYTDWHECCVKL